MPNEMNDRIESLKRVVNFGIQNGKKNLIVDLDIAELRRLGWREAK